MTVGPAEGKPAAPETSEEPHCPQCGSTVRPDWDWCHACGFDPDGLKAAGTPPRTDHGSSDEVWIEGEVTALPAPPSLAALPSPPPPRRPPLWDNPSGPGLLVAMLIVTLEIVMVFEAWASWQSFTYHMGRGGNSEVAESLLGAALLCFVLTLVMVYAFRRGNATRSLYLFTLVVAVVAILGGSAVIATRPHVLCEICVSGCGGSLDLFGPDLDGPSIYSTRQCSTEAPTSYGAVRSEAEFVNILINERRLHASATIAAGALTVLITSVLWLLDRRRAALGRSRT